MAHLSDTILQGQCCSIFGFELLKTIVIGYKKYKQAMHFFLMETARPFSSMTTLLWG